MLKQQIENLEKKIKFSKKKLMATVEVGKLNLQSFEKNIGKIAQVKKKL